jgi:thioredoxin reductase (NADPH)
MATTKPVLMTVDDDAVVLRAVERDLRRQYAERYRVMRADSGAAALGALKELKKRDDAVALFLVDQRMPQMSGVDFLGQALKLYPDAKRVLLTAYADTDAAIRAINEVQIQNYLLKPWDPPEEKLYPVLDDLLDDWQSAFRPSQEGIRVLGTRWSPQSYNLREFLARHQVPYRWLDVETASLDPEVKQLLLSLGTDGKFPRLVFPDGISLEAPTPAEMADRLGLQTRAEKEFYDLIIVGAGPAGLAAAVYGASEGLHTLLIERDAPGGQAGASSRIENYLGFPSGLSGADLARRAVAQARRFGVEILAPQEVIGLRVEGPYRFVKLQGGSEISCHALLIATGVQWRKLAVPGIDRLQGAGAYYGSSLTEASACKNEDVYMVGGANSAGQAAMHFSQYARRVMLLVRGSTLASSMSQYLIDEIQRRSNIEVKFNTEVAEAHGDIRLETLTLRDTGSGETTQVLAAALFIFIGAEPGTDWLAGVVERDDRGFILTGPRLIRDGKRPASWQLDREPWLMETSVPGIFAVGDVRQGSIKRVASGVGEGAIAVQFVHQYLKKV